MLEEFFPRVPLSVHISEDPRESGLGISDLRSATVLFVMTVGCTDDSVRHSLHRM